MDRREVDGSELLKSQTDNTGPGLTKDRIDTADPRLPPSKRKGKDPGRTIPTTLRAKPNMADDLRSDIGSGWLKLVARRANPMQEELCNDMRDPKCVAAMTGSEDTNSVRVKPATGTIKSDLDRA